MPCDSSGALSSVYRSSLFWSSLGLSQSRRQRAWQRQRQSLNQNSISLRLTLYPHQTPFGHLMLLMVPVTTAGMTKSASTSAAPRESGAAPRSALACARDSRVKWVARVISPGRLLSPHRHPDRRSVTIVTTSILPDSQAHAASESRAAFMARRINPPASIRSRNQT